MSEFTNMIMAHKNGRAAVINRTKSWCGCAFPGGHVERGESFYDSALRELYEETGLTAGSLKPCGVIQWIHADTDERYVVFCYRTDDFSGELLSGCDEGSLCWMTRDEIENTPSENDFKKYLPLFYGECSEAVGIYNDSGNISFEYR